MKPHSIQTKILIISETIGVPDIPIGIEEDGGVTIDDEWCTTTVDGGAVYEEGDVATLLEGLTVTLFDEE